MPVDNVETKSFWKQLLDLWRSVASKVRYGLLLLGVLAFILLELHIVQMESLFDEGRPNRITIIYFVALAAILIEVIFDTRRSVEKVVVSVKKLADNSSIGLKDLKFCTQDLALKLANLNPDQRIVMNHIGLSLDQSWSYFRDEFLVNRRLKNVNLRILMLPPSASEIEINSKYHPLPKKVFSWCNRAKDTLDEIKDYLEEVGPQIEQEGRRFQVEIRQYRFLPSIHGFSVAEPLEVHYLSFCRWKPSRRKPEEWDYDWGEESYHIVSCDTTDTAITDLANIFDSYFEYLWVTSTGALNWPPEDEDEAFKSGAA
jgi:hypothetical protein